MNSIQVNNSIQNRKLPTSSLDSTYNTITGLVPALIFLFGGLGPLISVRNNLSEITTLAFSTTGITFFIYTLYRLITDRKLKELKTGLSIEENGKLIELIAEQEKWRRLSYSTDYYKFKISRWFKSFHFEVTIIPIEDKILLNARKGYTVNGRLPYKFGIEKLIKNKIKNYAQHRL